MNPILSCETMSDGERSKEGVASLQFSRLKMHFGSQILRWELKVLVRVIRSLYLHAHVQLYRTLHFCGALVNE